MLCVIEGRGPMGTSSVYEAMKTVRTSTLYASDPRTIPISSMLHRPNFICRLDMGTMRT